MEQTQHLPRATVEDRFAADRPCPICAEVTLTVTHLTDLPDYVKCDSCDSVFVLDSSSDRVIYGSISPDYPATSRHALKRWMAIEAVQAKAAEERSPRVATEHDEPTPPFGATADRTAAATETDHTPTTPPFGFGQVQDDADRLGQGRAAPDRPAPSEHPPGAAPLEPERGQRFRVIVTGEPEFPMDHCAHCFRTPARRRISASGEFEPAHSFELPLCTICYARATAQSDGERNSRLVTHLSSILIGSLLFVLTLALSNFGLQTAIFISIGLAAAVGALGYGTAAFLILSRPTRFAPPDDAIYVQSTALIQFRKNENGLAFSWRNPRYAERFSTANKETVRGEITKIFESGRIQRPAVTQR